MHRLRTAWTCVAGGHTLKPMTAMTPWGHKQRHYTTAPGLLWRHPQLSTAKPQRPLHPQVKGCVVAARGHNHSSTSHGGSSVANKKAQVAADGCLIAGHRSVGVVRQWDAQGLAPG